MLQNPTWNLNVSFQILGGVNKMRIAGDSVCANACKTRVTNKLE